MKAEHKILLKHVHNMLKRVFFTGEINPNITISTYQHINIHKTSRKLSKACLHILFCSVTFK